MNIREVRGQLDTLKIHVDQLENWIRQTNDMIYAVEEKIFDYEDNIYLHNTFEILEEAASGI